MTPVCDAIGPDKVGVRISPENKFNDMQDSDPQQTFNRVTEMLDSFKLAYLHVLEGDISQPGLGLSDEDTAWVKDNCGSLIHNAASLQFISTSQESEPWRSNVQGTKYAIDFCHETNIDQFHHNITDSSSRR